MSRKQKMIAGASLAATGIGGAGLATYLTASRSKQVRDVTGRPGYPKKSGHKTYALGPFAVLVHNSSVPTFLSVMSSGDTGRIKQYVVQQERSGKLKAFKK